MEHLELFDNLDLEEQSERRAATRAIVDFYGNVLSQVGTRYLGFEPNDLTQGIGPQWNKSKDRLRTIEDIEIPEEYSSILNRLHNSQNSVDHQFQYNPERELLEEAREIAEEWASWFTQKATKFERTVGEQSARETMIRLTRQSLNSAENPPESFEYDDLIAQQKDFNDEVEHIRNRLEETEDLTEGISKELIFLMADATSLEQHQESFNDEYYQRKKEEAREDQWNYENTQPCYVTEPYGEFGNITMVTDEVGRTDQTMTINAHHPETPEQTFEKLKELEPNIRYQVTFGQDKTNTRYVKDVSR